VENTSCGKKFLFIRKKIGLSFVYSFLPALCKSWGCSFCRSKKSAVVRNFIERSFSGRQVWMLSLTYFHSGDPLDTWSTIGKTCNRLLTYARKYSGSFDYVRVIEPHADGCWPHVHILCSKPIATVEFVRRVTDWGFGWNFHSKPISADRAASYVSKYLTKSWPPGSAELNRVISGTRIVTASQSLGAIFATDHTWECINYDIKPADVHYFYSRIISLLKSAKCIYILSSAVDSGFHLISDIELTNDSIFSTFLPYVWRESDDYDFEYIPFGLQQELTF